MQEEEDTSFVSINLEPSECSICGSDTGESLTTCQLCPMKPTARGPIQIGFNQLPDVLHSGVKAHETCLVQEHQRLSKKSRSPFLHRRGCSVPKDFSSLGARETIGDKLQWLVNHSKNEDVKNRKNLLQVHSSPCTRSSSPVTLKGVSEVDILRRNSEINLSSCESGSVELRKSYTKYLYGTRLTQSQSDDNFVRKTQIVSETPITRITTVPDVRDTKSNNPLSSKDVKNTKKASKNDQEFNKSSRVGSNKIEITEGLTPLSDKLCHVLSLQDEGAEKRDVESETRRWSNKQKLNKDQLNKMSAAEMKKVVSNCENMIKEISADLVDLLQERDSLDQEVKVRNLTIQKLVKMKHQQQDMPIKTAGVGNI